MLSLMYYIKF